MNHPHVSSGGRYPVLRAVAVLYMVGALIVTVIGVWRAVAALTGNGDDVSRDMFGAATNASGRLMAAVCWIAAAFIGDVLLLGIAELVKLFIDIEHNTRVLALHGMAPAGTSAVSAANGTAHEGPAIPFIRDRKILEGEETAEGALLRGH